MEEQKEERSSQDGYLAYGGCIGSSGFQSAGLLDGALLQQRALSI